MIGNAINLDKLIISSFVWNYRQYEIINLVKRIDAELGDENLPLFQTNRFF